MQQTNDFINQFAAQRSQAGDSQSQIDDDLADRLCLVRIDNGTGNGTESAPAALTASTNSAVSVTPPSIYWDNDVHRYYAISKWRWVNNSFSNDTYIAVNTAKSLGGKDGFATSFNQKLLLTGYSLTVYGDAPYASSANISTVETSNASGAGYTFQDKARCDLVPVSQCDYNLNVRSGQEVISFKESGTCMTVYGFASYSHTWSSTAVNSIGIAPYSIGFGWSSSSSHWTRASQPGGTATVC